MEEIMLKIAQDSAIAAVAMFALWRQSVALIAVAGALVEVSKMNAKTLAEQSEHLK